MADNESKSTLEAGDASYADEAVRRISGPARVGFALAGTLSALVATGAVAVRLLPTEVVVGEENAPHMEELETLFYNDFDAACGGTDPYEDQRTGFELGYGFESDPDTKDRFLGEVLERRDGVRKEVKLGLLNGVLVAISGEEKGLLFDPWACNPARTPPTRFGEPGDAE